MNKKHIEWMDYSIDWLIEEYQGSDEPLCFSEFVEKKFKEAGGVKGAGVVEENGAIEIMREDEFGQRI